MVVYAISVLKMLDTYMGPLENPKTVLKNTGECNAEVVAKQGRTLFIEN